MPDPTTLPLALRLRRVAVISCASASGLLVLVSMLVDPAPAADGVEMLRSYAENLTASGAHTNLIHYGFALIAPVAYAVVGLVHRRGAWLANLAGVLAVIGLSTLPGLVLLDFAGVAAWRASDPQTTEAVTAGMDELGWFTAIVAPAFFAAVLALPVAVTALWRAGLVPWFLPLVVLAGPLAMNVAPWFIGFPLNALCMLVLAVFLARIPASRWYPNQSSS